MGIVAIDAQHRHFFEQAARLELALNSREPACRIEQLFEALASYAKVHFAAEERVMQEHGYPDVADHAREHSEFIRRLRSLFPQLETEGDSKPLVIALHGLIDCWLVDHITRSDQRVSDFVRAASSAMPTRDDMAYRSGADASAGESIDIGDSPRRPNQSPANMVLPWHATRRP